MEKYDISREATDDLYEIWEYTLETWSEDQADKYYSTIVQTFSNIADDPSHIGKPFDEIIEGLRAVHIRRHMVFYMVQESGKVLIVRVLHERMDFKRHF